MVNNLFNRLDQISENHIEEHSNRKYNNCNNKSPDFNSNPKSPSDFNYNQILFSNSNNLILNNSNININIINNK